jgi:hypothetical protein
LSLALSQLSFDPNNIKNYLGLVKFQITLSSFGR